MIHIAGVLIQKDGKILLVQEKQPHVYGLWNIPAGHVDHGETIKRAAKREGEEETGYKIKVQNKINDFPIAEDVIVHVFTARIESGEISFNPEELLAVRWFTPQEIKKLPLRENFIKQLIGIQ